MTLAEQKQRLLKIVQEADEETTVKLIDFAEQLQGKTTKFSEEELNRFHSTRQEYLKNPQDSISLEDAHTYIRSLKKK